MGILNKQIIKNPIKEIILGIIFIFIGLTYGGSSRVMIFGFIILGLVIMIVGIYRSIKSRRKKEIFQKEEQNKKY